mmetsp:Transcript_94330/g.131068  ORF Transcript_94330/g.131068 Transcript_94330/m.131068 type:complete len:242 (+) Transcript_94330:883-1608(+)
MLRSTVLKFYGDDAEKSDDYSRMINEFHSNRMKSYLDENHGGKVVIGGKCNIANRFVAPTIVDEPRKDSKMMVDEIFGPILPVMAYKSIDEVIDFINDRPKPLALYYYGSGSSENWKRIKSETSSGSIMLNESIIQFVNGNIPFGGVGNSGIGSVHGFDGFKEVVHFKPVMERGTYNGFPFSSRFGPYNATKKAMLVDTLKKSQLRQSSIYRTLGLIILFISILIAYAFGAFDCVKNHKFF